MTTFRSSAVGRDWQHPALTEALRMASLPKRKASDADRPAPKPLPGPKRLPGQLSLDEHAAA